MTLPDITILDNSLERWGLALLVTLGATLLLRLAKAIIVSRVTALSRRTSTYADDVAADALRGTRSLTLLAGGVAAGLPFLQLPERAASTVGKIIALVLIVQVGLWAVAAVVGWLHRYRDRKLEDDRGAATSVGAMTFLAQVAVWTLTLLIALDNIGVDITALVTGLGIGGVAVALALQNVLGDLFASLSIVMDKPFVIGDFIIVGEHLGAVEHVGLKTTRIRSLSGEQLVFANSDLLSSRIRNFGRMAERRVVFKLGVTYDTSQDSLRRIPEIIRAAIEEHQNTRFDRSHFASYGDFALQFESVYYVSGADYNVYMDVQQAINLRIRERFMDAGIEFAYPTQTLLVHSAAAADYSSSRSK